LSFDRDDYQDDWDDGDWEPLTEYLHEDGSAAPNPDEVSGYEVVEERVEPEYDDDGAVDGVVRLVLVRKLPTSLEPSPPLRRIRDTRPVRRSPRARCARSAKARLPDREDDDPHEPEPPAAAADPDENYGLTLIGPVAEAELRRLLAQRGRS
jgi:hypothetical protein